MKVQKVIQVKDPFSVPAILSFVHLCSQYASDVYMYKGTIAYNPKCVLGAVQVMILLKESDEVTLIAEGSDAEEALGHIEEFFLSSCSPPVLKES
ncbi:HPr family phosphocarrier protein [Salipaludibacillus aurantiacus]|uniref:Phosphocarrier protein n=1 Tax=Salipaludibacillus aurantiacus TaxID=1601833 RepID=A0A1H9WGJ9_9BACI|nr:HPr family phosphocarrier protein [Salipaludibacillus aurantiacus]SES32807.1 phosphocarrier protein [Salipaludibacillus aurantiacus]